MLLRLTSSLKILSGNVIDHPFSFMPVCRAHYIDHPEDVNSMTVSCECCGDLLVYWDIQCFLLVKVAME